MTPVDLWTNLIQRQKQSEQDEAEKAAYSRTSLRILRRLPPTSPPAILQTLFVHTNGPFLLTAVLPGTPTVLAPLHPPGLGQGERAVR